MRLLHTLTALVLAVSTVTVAPQVADACGGSYGSFDIAPTVHVVSTHQTPNGRRAFIALGPSAVTRSEGTWERLFPSSYDYSATRDASYAPRRTFTLVGPSGTRVVSTANTVLLTDTFILGFKTQRTSEVRIRRGEDFVIAIEGNNVNARWIDLEDLTATLPTITSGRMLGGLLVGGRTYVIVQANGSAVARLVS
jgi:hypothetical protein